MFGLNKKLGRPRKREGQRAVYKQVAVTPEAHAKLRQVAERNNSSIIDTVDHILGV